MYEENHRAMKRWERARQMQTVRSQPQSAGPTAWCRLRAPESIIRAPIRLLALYAGDFAYVRAAMDSVPAGAPGPAWLTRGGVEWESYLGALLRYYELGRPVPREFTPLRKWPSELVGRLRALPESALPTVFGKLRSEGMLPALAALSRDTCPPGLPWEDLRARFVDFSRDIPPR